jgi:hypothetical protein
MLIEYSQFFHSFLVFDTWYRPGPLRFLLTGSHTDATHTDAQKEVGLSLMVQSSLSDWRRHTVGGAETIIRRWSQWHQQQIVACIGPVMVEAVLEVVKDAFVDLVPCWSQSIRTETNG